MHKADTSSEAVERLIGAGCARNVPVELHYETAGGAIVMGRVRLLELTERQFLADRPLYSNDDAQIPTGAAISVHVLLDGVRYQFDSAIEESKRLVRLNARQRVPGIALRRPAVMAESQRRSHLRISMATYDPINIDLVRPDPTFPDACSIDAELVAAWMLDLSVGGVSVLVDHRILNRVQQTERFFLTFALPSVDDEFYMLGSHRHSRVVEASDSLRIGLSFRPWRDRQFTHDQRRLSRFIAEHERSMLRRRK
ncbi:MAG: hypothetical protein WBE26_06835 [Phycisphaerae bacterium]